MGWNKAGLKLSDLNNARDDNWWSINSSNMDGASSSPGPATQMVT